MQKQIQTEEGGIVWLTDDPAQAQKLLKIAPVIGIDSKGTGEGWSGIGFLAENEAAVDGEYAQLAWCRYYGKPRTLVRTANWRVREAKQEDAVYFLRLYTDPQVLQYLSSPLRQQDQDSSKEKEQWEAWIAGLIRYTYGADEPGMWVLADSTDRMLGIIGLEWKQQEAHIPEGYYLGYALLPEARKQKLAAKAASQLIPYCMEYWSLEQIYLLCDRKNFASVKTALSCGFTLVSGQELIQHPLNDGFHMGAGEFLLFARK